MKRKGGKGSGLWCSPQRKPDMMSSTSSLSDEDLKKAWKFRKNTFNVDWLKVQAISLRFRWDMAKTEGTYIRVAYKNVFGYISTNSWPFFMIQRPTIREKCAWVGSNIWRDERPVFFGFSIFCQMSQLATEKIQNLCNRNRWSGLLQLSSVRFRSFFPVQQTGPANTNRSYLRCYLWFSTQPRQCSPKQACCTLYSLMQTHLELTFYLHWHSLFKYRYCIPKKTLYSSNQIILYSR